MQDFVLDEPFRGCGLFEVALFLRFAYHPRDLSSANLAAVQDHLPALLRLVHRLDAGQVLRALCDHMSGGSCLAAASWAGLG